MSRIPSVFECQSCGYSSSKWLGRCPDCGNWNSFVEGKEITPTKRDTALGGDRTVPVALSEISTESTPRVSTANEEFDRVLGGGIVPGSLVLLGGEPGEGKSTLLLLGVTAAAFFGVEFGYYVPIWAPRTMKPDSRVPQANTQ